MDQHMVETHWQVAMTALNVLKDEGMVKIVENGKYYCGHKNLKRNFLVKTVRGKGLFAAMEIEPHGDVNAWNVCMKMKDNGLLAKPTHDHIIRLAPPLIINELQLEECLTIIRNTLKSVS